MLKLTIHTTEELWNEEEQTFFYDSSSDVILELEHSLVSLSKWESEFQKPFLASGEKSSEEVLAYIRAMIITKDYPKSITEKFTKENFLAINNYIESKQSATTFGKMPDRKGRGETITSELVYYWMVAFNIPFECETWHLNRLFSLIQICNVKNAKPEKQSKHAIAQRNRELNEQRRKEFGTNG
jgi:hypothetical protein